MEFHIARALRDRLELDAPLFQFTGNVVFGNVTGSRRLAQQLSALSEAEGGAPEMGNAGALFAMGLIDELSHAMIARYRAEVDPEVFGAALQWFGSHVGAEELAQLVATFADRFPNLAVYRGELSVAEWLEGTTDGIGHREAALEELLLLWLANGNPAFAPFKLLFDEQSLLAEPAYLAVTARFSEFFETRPEVGTAGTLLDVLMAPMLAHPDSLAGQLEYIRENWAPYLGEELRRTLLAVDTLREEDIAIWMRFHPPTPGRFGQRGGPDWGAAGFVGDEYIGFEGEAERRRLQYASDHQAPLNEYEAFSQDQDWMPTVVLMAKSTYVWLEQLSKKYGRHIHRLDQIPDEELRLMASRGMTGLWLIGLWERSVASRTIKRLRGQEDAVASAYSLKDYQIAEDLGGPAAYESLREHAARAGIRLASDMVPNHMGIDSNWVIDHPDWFISRPESPYPVYSFEGPDLSTDSRVEIKIEDHYYDQTDAAVVFRLRHHASGETRYTYHGNDGTTFAWNDTAQLDYSKAYVREQVIQAILHVARMFPIIRFDAAMTLAKRHVQRLWFPLPGVGGSIPSRAESAMTQEQFDEVMPHEFWREVVDRVAAEVPGTLLLAEAFWMLEGYFVRTLGMHRVYNSAFMNMLRDEENAKYRSYLKKTIEFDPDILKRYVNFMSNPDERTTIDQFGSGDKCFGVATLMSTLPGLPMFGHGQIEGFTERYGMEYKRARMDESPDERLTARHQAEIAPLLKRRHVFAESANFVLYDFWTDGGSVDENVFAYSNRAGDERAIILYNNAYNSTRGTIRTSAAAMDKYTGELQQRQLSEAVGLPSDERIVAFRDAARNLSFLRRSRDFDHYGLTVDLRGYQYMVLQDWRVLESTEAYPWDRLCDALSGAGVHDLDDALSKLRLRPLHEALREVVSREHTQAFADAAQAYAAQILGTKANGASARKNGASTKAAPAGKVLKAAAAKNGSPAAGDRGLQEFARSASNFYAQLRAFSGGSDGGKEKGGLPESDGLAQLATAASRLPGLEREFSSAWPASVRSVLPSLSIAVPSHAVWAPVLAYLVLRAAKPSLDLATFDNLQLRSALAEIFSTLELHGDDAWRAAARVRLLLGHGGDGSSAIPLGDDAFWQDGDATWLAGVNASGGTTYLNKELFEALVCWLQLPALLRVAQKPSGVQEIEREVSAAVESAVVAGYKLADVQKRLQSRTPPAPSADTHEGGAPGAKKAGEPKQAAARSSQATIAPAKEPVLAGAQGAGKAARRANKPAKKGSSKKGS